MLYIAYEIVCTKGMNEIRGACGSYIVTSFYFWSIKAPNANDGNITFYVHMSCVLQDP